MNKRSSILAVFLISLFATPLLCAFAEATVPLSTVSSDTTWTKAESPYELSGPLRVDSGATLTIEAGVTINLNGYYMQIDGELRVLGSDAEPVQFIGGATDRFDELHFTSLAKGFDDKAESGCIIEHAVFNDTKITLDVAVKVDDSTFYDYGSMTVDNIAISMTSGSSYIVNNNIYGAVMVHGGTALINYNKITGGMAIYGGVATVSYNQISGRSSYFYIGRDWDRDYNTLVVKRSSALLTYNNIRGNIMSYDTDTLIIADNTVEGIGFGSSLKTVILCNTVEGEVGGEGPALIQRNYIKSADVGIYVADGAIVQNNTISANGTGISIGGTSTISYNNIIDCQEYRAKLVDVSTDVNATYNWWGTADTQAISQSIYDHKNDFNIGPIIFEPILTTSNPYAMPDPNLPIPSLEPEATPLPYSTDPPATATPLPPESSTPQPSAPDQSGSHLQIPWETIAIPVLVAAIVIIIIIAVQTGNRSRP
jgi:hypothetical protein